MHGNRMNAIARAYRQGYKAARIMRDFQISRTMLRAVLVDTGLAKTMDEANLKLWGRR